MSIWSLRALNVLERVAAKDKTRRNSSTAPIPPALNALAAVRMAAAAPPPPAEPTPEPTAAFSLLPAELALLSSLSVTEKLLVAQATYELGSQDFKGVAKLLQGHALLKERGKSFFSADVSRLELGRSGGADALGAAEVHQGLYGADEGA